MVGGLSVLAIPELNIRGCEVLDMKPVDRLRKVSCVLAAAVLVVSLVPFRAYGAEGGSGKALSAASIKQAQGTKDQSDAWFYSKGASVKRYHDPSIPRPRADCVGPHSIKVSWKKVRGAKSYVVYRNTYEAGSSRKSFKWKRVKVVSAKELSWTDDAVKEFPCMGRRGCYAVAACRAPNGKKPGKRSYWVEALAFSDNASEVNVGKVSAKKKSLKVAIGGNLAVKAKTKPSAYGKKHGNKKGFGTHDFMMRLISSDESVIASSNGEVWNATGRAVGKGTCTVRAIAPNGVMSVPVRVKVAGHERPGEFTLSKEGRAELRNPELLEHLNENRDLIYEVTEALYVDGEQKRDKATAAGIWPAKWAIRKGSDGTLKYPAWMGQEMRQKILKLFSHRVFNESFYLREIVYCRGDGGVKDGHFSFNYYSAEHAEKDKDEKDKDDLFSCDCYRVIGSVKRGSEYRLAKGWWLNPYDYELPMEA